MAGLILKLRPSERLLINGAVIENGDRRCRLNIISPGANVLRLRDAVHPADANTPVKRACYIAQLLLAGEVGEDAARGDLVRSISQLQSVLTDPESSRTLSEAAEYLKSDQIYQVLRELRTLLPLEDRLMRA
ncbi:flagellar biosynthesis repressor FlbT [Pontivivens insulae]|uniref:Flagellum biosynthesis repressor protein FlbT n=1 Tax=Pontivivens insulae TaxID=1639689 RepID=A0A2R8A9F3_9RHOB|nr:flagellar biosynthesis repressor FlbT [Pontivivens insulae]RED12762.1 flagellar protein FlbT [Pontivivens insulae]SPF28853.1 flagellum biosynthesis repressor protein FlbT [Pontivivens insulae]